jgi:hypothetical protein
MVDTHVLLSIARIATAALAGVISVLGIRAYGRTRRTNILAMGVGAGVLAAGYLAEGLLIELFGWTLHDATVLESVSTLVAATILVSSIYLRGARDAAPPIGRPERPEGARP